MRMTIQRITILTVGVVFLCFLAQRTPATAHSNGGYSHDSDPDYTNTDWLSSVPGCLRLSEISWPGTHDTMSRPGTDYSKTQSMTLATQLESGIRVVDIRVRHIADSFALHHGPVFLDAFFGGDVMEPVIAFLQAHPRETVLMRIKDEYDAADNNTRTFQETFDWYMSIYGGYVWTPTGSIPTLSEVRGKIVILQDFTSEPDNKYGIDYGDLDDQDYYTLKDNYDLYNKWEKVKAHIVKARDGNRDTMYINYLSGSFKAGEGPVFPYFVASGHSSPGTGAPRLATGRTTPGWSSWPDFPRVDCLGDLCTIAFEGTNILTYNYIQDGHTGFTGIIMADFPGGGLIDAVIKLNPTNHAPVATAGGPYMGNEGTPITFSAAGSSDADGNALLYRWDIDGNGTWDTPWSASPLATFTWADDWTGTVKVAVSDGCDASIASAPVTIVNVPPQVTITQIADGEPFILTNLVVNLRTAFSDPGSGDTHAARIDWQNGEPPTTVRNPAANPLVDSRVYTVPGTYSVTVTVQDDDGGVGQASASVRILTAQEALPVLIANLRARAGSRDIASAIANLEGNNGGKAKNGAVDELAKGNVNAAFGKLQKALEDLLAAEQATPGLDLARDKALLTNIGRSIALDAIARAAAGASPVKVEQARTLLSQGVALQNAGDDFGALLRYRDAARRVQSV